jgi:hypothetical protein
MIGGHQLERAKLTEFVEKSTSEPVLTAFAASDGEELSLDSMTARLQRKHASVFVIRMRYYLHQSSSGAKLANLEFESVDA